MLNKKIIIAGAGHGGLAVAALLSRKGFDVTVYEKSKRENMGYDWTDTFDLSSLDKVGITLPDESMVEKSTNITFCTPYESSIIVQDISEEALTVKIERRVLYDILINNAIDSGVKIEFENEILSPLLAGDRVIGIKTVKGNYYADLIIDACGYDSVIRKNLPECVGIQKETEKNEKFYVYRALYSKGKEALHKYKVYLMPNGKMGIGWVINDKNYSDVLIGEFEPFDMDEVERQLSFFKEHNSVIGDELLRGGSFAEIPVRHTLSILVADGYAAIGDSAFMTVPLLGSGISNSLCAASILADVIAKDETCTYSAETLWNYQIRYYNELGFSMAKMAVVKCMLPHLTAEQVEYAFESELLTRDVLTISNGSPLSPNPELVKKAIALIKDKQLTALIAGTGKNLGLLAAVSTRMPEDYSRKRVIEWAEKYDNIFR